MRQAKLVDREVVIEWANGLWNVFVRYWDAANGHSVKTVDRWFSTREAAQRVYSELYATKAA